MRSIVGFFEMLEINIFYCIDIFKNNFDELILRNAMYHTIPFGYIDNHVQSNLLEGVAETQFST